ncbi:SDR family oxidoreductase [Sphingomonas sp. AP4-R1]|uniref:SDR family oxidoreductase n=1 Tax=Sphingomonas sp. AP4-R1 TaxID=2735134 RepID=UPI0014938383|nr:SDR family oxidoreductase [Sphingomonas sp. AP4-R1]QJU57816.1 SDR family oxidoreductase [Sphingomonas sp. AP4-R1]
MRIFVTGATGFIGSRVVTDLIGAGHQVIGAARSDEGADRLRAAGAEVHIGTLEEPAGLAAGAEQADGVIHTAFDHDFSNFLANCEKDRRVIAALGDVLKGSDRPLLITSGVGMGIAAPGELAREDVFNTEHPNPRIASELAGAALLDQGLNVAVVRLPQVHDTERQGLITYSVMLAREKGVSAYVGEGRTRWSAAPVADVARLYRLALEKAQPGARYHAVAEEGVSAREIAEILGRGLGIPVVSLPKEEAMAHFGWMGMFADLDLPASSAWTREALGWAPTGPSLAADLEGMFGLNG